MLLYMYEETTNFRKLPIYLRQATINLICKGGAMSNFLPVCQYQNIDQDNGHQVSTGDHLTHEFEPVRFHDLKIFQIGRVDCLTVGNG